jgi:hypothetical protein
MKEKIRKLRRRVRETGRIHPENINKGVQSTVVSVSCFVIYFSFMPAEV